MCPARKNWELELQFPSARPVLLGNRVCIQNAAPAPEKPQCIKLPR